MFICCEKMVQTYNVYLNAGACAGGGGEGGVAELGLPNVAGVFIVTVIGCMAAL